MGFTDDKEIQEYRRIMEPPKESEFRDGYNWKTVAGAIFLGFIVMPATEYLSLVMGNDANMGAAMKWIMVILFAEVAKRSFTTLRTQELYTLHFMAGAALADPFKGFLWAQYVAQSEYIQGLGIAAMLPSWAFPRAAAIEAAGRTLFAWHWLPIILLTMYGMIISRIDNYGLGYVLYRMVSDVEKLPFPFAPVGAAGIVALSTDRGEETTWRWRCFSIGGAMGIIWGIIFICVPMITEAILPKRIELIPMIFIDYSPQVGRILPAVPFTLVLNFAAFLSGMIVPFWGVVGSFFGLVFTWVANPFLVSGGVLTSWAEGDSFIDTMFNNQLDFYLSFQIGLTLAVTLSGLFIFFSSTLKDFFKKSRKHGEVITHKPSFGQRMRENWKTLVTNNKARGDFSIFIAAAIYLCSTGLWIAMGWYLIDVVGAGGYPLMIMIFYALIYTPLISYATAKLEGICGQAVNVPFLKEATILFTGYKGVELWFAPMPFSNVGPETVGFRILELTGTKIISQIKTLLLTLPIITVASFLTSELLWRMNDIPSSAYPYTEMMWELQLRNWSLWITATLEGGSQVLEAIDGSDILWGFGMGSGLFAVLSLVGLPVMLIYGAVWGLAQSNPGALFCTMLGAAVARLYFKRKYKEMWLKYMTAIMAGFGCGMGITSMIAMSFNIIVSMLTPVDW